MKSQTHFVASLAMTPWVFLLGQNMSPAGGLVASIAFLAGAKAPDWLELRWWIWGRRFSLIPHRTITHTWWAWIFAGLASWLYGASDVQRAAAIAFCASCLFHIFMDALTPMGVPLINPFGARRRLDLGWASRDVGFLLVLAPPSFWLWWTVVSA